MLSQTQQLFPGALPLNLCLSTSITCALLRKGFWAFIIIATRPQRLPYRGSLPFGPQIWIHLSSNPSSLKPLFLPQAAWLSFFRHPWLWSSLLSGPELAFHQLVVAHTGRTIAFFNFGSVWLIETKSLSDFRLNEDNNALWSLNYSRIINKIKNKFKCHQNLKPHLKDRSKLNCVHYCGTLSPSILKHSGNSCDESIIKTQQRLTEWNLQKITINTSYADKNINK